MASPLRLTKQPSLSSCNWSVRMIASVAMLRWGQRSRLTPTGSGVQSVSH